MNQSDIEMGKEIVKLLYRRGMKDGFITASVSLAFGAIIGALLVIWTEVKKNKDPKNDEVESN